MILFMPSGLIRRLGVGGSRVAGDSDSPRIWPSEAVALPSSAFGRQHMSRAMLERYSHIRMAAKRDAVSGVTLRQKIGNSEVVPVIVPVVAQIATIQ